MTLISKIIKPVAAAAFVGAVSLAPVSIAPAAAETTLTMATVNAVGSLINRVGNRFRDEVNGENSTIKINHVEGPVLGNAPQVMDQTISGAVDIMGTDMAWVSPFHPDLKILNWSFAFRDTAHLDKFFDSDVFKEIVDTIAKDTGVRVLAARSSQPRYFHSRVPINSAADIKGLKVRVPQIKVFIDSWEAMGAVPTPLNYSEVFLAMKTGVIDGAFGNPSDTFPNNFHLSGPNIVRTGDTTGSSAIIINEARWQSLSDAEKALVQKYATEAIEWSGVEAKSEMDGVVQKMIATGANIKDIDLTPLREATGKRALELEAAGEWSKGLYDKIQAIQ